MSSERLQGLWRRLTPSAREMLTKTIELLIDRHSGVIELHCHKGGVRNLRVGQEYRPGQMERHIGEDTPDESE